MTNEQLLYLEQTACRVRQGVIVSTHAAKSGHPGGSLGAADIFTALYFSEMDVDPKNPAKPSRDRFVLSKGHCAPGLYAALALRGFFPVEDLATLRHPGSHLQGHPNMLSTPGVDMSTGSLGQGVSAACGMALAAKARGEAWRTYTLLGDGEIAEGECWEAFMFAAHYKLDNLCVIIDLNGLQIDGYTADVMDSSPMDKKMAAFGFEVFELDGNDIAQVVQTLEKARQVKGRPSCLLARTIKGKGVSFMEGQASWHGKATNDEQTALALAELAQQEQQLGGGQRG